MTTQNSPSASDVQSVSPVAYARWRSTLLGRTTETLEQNLLLQLAGPIAGKRVLEISCGDGELLCRLIAGEANVTGIDIDRDMLKAANAKTPNASILMANACYLPFEVNSFDLVFASSRTATPPLLKHTESCALEAG